MSASKAKPSGSSIGLDLNALQDSSSGSSSKSPLEPETAARTRQQSTCVEPDHRELIRSVSVVLHRRIRDNEDAESKLLLPLFCEDTHTEPVPEPEYRVNMPMIPTQTLGFPTLFTLTELPPPPVVPRVYDIPSIPTICTFIENIWHRARLTPQSVVICLVYVDRLEARSEGVLLHARSWRPIVFSSLLLASKVWHDVSYWNSDFSSICPMFTLRNINRMELAYLKLLEYNTIISSSQYAQYYFSLRHALREARHPPRPPTPPARPSACTSCAHAMCMYPLPVRMRAHHGSPTPPSSSPDSGPSEPVFVLGRAQVDLPIPSTPSRLQSPVEDAPSAAPATSRHQPIVSERGRSASSGASAQGGDSAHLISTSADAHAPSGAVHPTPPHASSSSGRESSVGGAGDGERLVQAERVQPRRQPAGGGRGQNFRQKYFMAINVPGAARLQAQTEALASSVGSTNGPGSKLMAPGGEEVSDDLPPVRGLGGGSGGGGWAVRPTRQEEPRMLPTRETIRRDGEIVREIGLSNSTAALAPWMRPPTPLSPPAAAPAVANVAASSSSSSSVAVGLGNVRGANGAASDAAALRLATISASPDANVAVNLEGMEQMAELALEGSPAASPPPPPVAPVVRSGARSFDDGRSSL